MSRFPVVSRPARVGTRALIAVGLTAAALLVAAQAACASSGDLWLYGAAGTQDTGQPVMAQTSPSIAALYGGGGYGFAYQTSSGQLGAGGAASTGGVTLGLAPGTSPAIAALTGGGWEIAFQNSANGLQSIGAGGWRTWGLGMTPGTSPDVAGMSNGSYELAFQALGGHLWTAGTFGAAGNDRDVAMDPYSSPSITIVGSSYEVAAEDNTGRLNLLTQTTADQTDLGMTQNASSPDIASLDNGGEELAFAAPSNNDLWVTDENLGPGDTGLQVAAGTSPSIAALAGGGYEVAFQGSNGHLLVYGTDGTQDTGLGMAPGTSPSITGLNAGGYEVAFQSNAQPVTSVPVPAGGGARQLRVKVLFTWTWSRSHTRLAKVQVGRHPRDTVFAFQCQGRGCPARLAARHRGYRKLKAARRAIVGSRYRPGDHIVISIAAKGYSSQRAQITIRRGKVPLVKAL